LVVAALLALALNLVHGSDVVHVTSDDFDSVVGGDLPAFVEFYAPWCGHCKNLAPEYEIVASSMKSAGAAVRVVAVDADKHRDIASRFGVTGYPALKFFPAGAKEGESYSGGRTAPDIIDFINKKIGSNVRTKSAPSAVVVLTPDNFDSIVKDPSKNVLVEFYAPWCGHCKRLAPEYDKVGKTFEGEDSVVIAKCDSDAHRELGQQFGVQSFPTIKFFPKDNKAGEDYSGGRTVEDFVSFINTRADTDRIIGGGFSQNAGRISELDELARQFVAASSNSDKQQILQQAEQVVASDSVTNHKNSKYAKFYTLAMKKLLVEADYVSKESGRLQRMLGSSALKSNDFVQFNKRINVLQAFSA